MNLCRILSECSSFVFRLLIIVVFFFVVQANLSPNTVLALPTADEASEAAVQPGKSSLIPATAASEAIQEHETEAGEQEHAAEGDDDHGPMPPTWLILPFAILLLMIATGPLFYARHWHRYYPRYAVVLGIVVAVYYIFVMHSITPMVHALAEFLSFIALVASLFIAASCIFLKMNARGTPLSNSIVLFAGSIIANLIATTGAAMLFIRPYMRLNQGRLKPYHIVFFIFLVANVGGALTPIGDPPLFLGFLRGVPFFWTLTHVWYVWLPTTLLIIGIFAFFDSRNKTRGPEPDPNEPTIAVVGKKSFFWVIVIIISVFIDPSVFSWVPALHIGSVHLPVGIREIIMFTVAIIAYKTANIEALQKNEFTFEPIREVGWLFLGIFATMQPALQLIGYFASQNADSLTVGIFYWGTGALSGILDNAPTYLNFLSAAMGKFGMNVNLASDVVAFASHAESWFYLQAISVAAVFFGALTYIGNAPNFMVKSIAESNGVETPSFAGYLVKYSLPILLPVYFVVYLVFYSGWIL